MIERLVVGPLGTNCYLAGEEEGGEAVAIDPGGNVPLILAKLREHRWTLRYIINTHGHMDHIAGNGDLLAATGARLAIHPADAGMLKDPEANMSKWYNDRPVSSPGPDETWEEGRVVQVGGITFTVIHTPGHTPGGICLLAGVSLFAGDTLFAGSIGRTDFPGGDHGLLVEAIRQKLFVLPDAIRIYPGHGSSTTIGEEKQFNPFF